MDDIPAMTPPRPDAGANIDWDRPVGYSHAAVLATLAEKRK